MNTAIASDSTSIIRLTEFELEQTVGGDSTSTLAVSVGGAVAVLTAPAWVVAVIGVAAIAGATYAAVQIWG
jgi:hypothetical protein